MSEQGKGWGAVTPNLAAPLELMAPGAGGAPGQLTRLIAVGSKVQGPGGKRTQNVDAGLLYWLGFSFLSIR